MEYKTKYFRLDSGGLVKHKGSYIAYLDKDGKWIVDRNLISMFVGGDSNYEEITSDEARKIVESRGAKFE